MEISFSYISTFISLVYGLALAHALSCIAEYIQHYKEIKHYWVWWIWSIFLLMLSIGFWWSIYVFWSKMVIWEISYFAYITLQSCLFYLMFYIYFDHFHELKEKDLEIHFYKYKTPFFVLLSFQFLLMMVFPPIIFTDFNFTEIGPNIIFPLILSILIFSFAFINNKRMNVFFAIMNVALFLSQIIFMN